ASSMRAPIVPRSPERMSSTAASVSSASRSMVPPMGTGSASRRARTRPTASAVGPCWPVSARRKTRRRRTSAGAAHRGGNRRAAGPHPSDRLGGGAVLAGVGEDKDEAPSDVDGGRAPGLEPDRGGFGHGPGVDAAGPAVGDGLGLLDDLVEGLLVEDGGVEARH